MTDDTDQDDEDGDLSHSASNGFEVLPGVHEFTVTEAETGQRLDRFLTNRFGGALSRARLQAVVREGGVASEGAIVSDPGGKVKSGQRITVSIPEAAPAKPEAEAIPLAIVYEDPHLLVLDKPAGLVVHPAAGHSGGTLVNALLAHCGDELSGIGGVRRPGIVHRLDKDTSGLLVVAKSDAAHRGLSDQFAAHGTDGRLSRAYEAFVWGVPLRKSGAIDANLDRSTTNRTRMAVVRDTQGRRAVTHYEVLESFAGPSGEARVSRLRLVLETGRTHQIRVHLAHLGHPVMGDPVYGVGFKASTRNLSPEAASALEALGRQALHAMELGFEHPITGKPLHFTSSRPADIEHLYETLKMAAPTGPAPRPRKRMTKLSKP